MFYFWPTFNILYVLYLFMMFYASDPEVCVCFVFHVDGEHILVGTSDKS